MTKIFLSIPSLNQGRYLRFTLERLFSRGRAEIAAAVLDGGSEDYSPEIIRRHQDRLAFWRSHPDRGQSAAINEGIEKSPDSTYVGWVNADDIVFPEKLLLLAEYLDMHPYCVAVFGDAEIIDKEGVVRGMYPTKPFDFRSFSRTCTISQPASLIRKSAWDAVGGLDEELHYAMDYDLWWKLAKIGEIGYVEEVIAQSRDHEETKTRTGYREAIETCMVVLKRHIGHVPFLWVVRYLLNFDLPWLKHVDKKASPRSWPLKVKFKHIVLSLTFFYKINGISGMIRSLFFYVFPQTFIKRD
jgi:GT2 family glycosyltransferase